MDFVIFQGSAATYIREILYSFYCRFHAVSSSERILNRLSFDKVKVGYSLNSLKRLLFLTHPVGFRTDGDVKIHVVVIAIVKILLS